MAEVLEATEEDRIMVFLPLFHANPQMYAVMTALETGCALILRPKLSVSRFFEDARRFGATLFTYVGTVLAMLTSRVREEVRDHSIRACVGGGCPADIWRAMEERFGIVPRELYGMTEVGGWVSANRPGASRPGSVGPIRPDVEVAVLGPDDRPVLPGARGEIAVRPKAPNTILLGYWRNERASWEASRNLWFHTGDAGKFDEDGYLYFLGRTTEIIRRGGENISPTELETVLLDHPDVEDAAVVGVPDAIWGEEIKAVLVSRRAFEPRDLHRFLDGRVPAYMMPRYVQFVETIARTETQKIQRKALRDNPLGVVDLRGNGR
jgi:crotonobetaine/carnitine-CoA ligase